MFHLWTYSKTVKVSEAYWITTLTVISWYVTGNVIKKGQINTAFLKRDIVMPTLTFNIFRPHLETKKETSINKLYLQHLTLNYKFHWQFMKVYVTAIKMKQRFLGIKFTHLNLQSKWQNASTIKVKWRFPIRRKEIKVKYQQLLNIS